MAFTESTMLPLGSEAPPFALPDTVSGKTIRLPDIASDKATVVMFICNHCPYVIHVNDEIIRVANEYTLRGVAFVAISSNDVVNYPQESPRPHVPSLLDWPRRKRSCMAPLQTRCSCMKSVLMKA